MKHGNSRFIVLSLIFGFAFFLTHCDEKSAVDSPLPVKKVQPQTEAKAENIVPDKIVAYYFHGDRRCKTCLGIQSAIVQTIKERFSTETAENLLVFEDVNFDQDANKHFLQDFDLSFSSLIVVAKAGDKIVKWENCSKVWEFAHERPVLMDYAEGRIRVYLDMLKNR